MNSRLLYKYWLAGVTYLGAISYKGVSKPRTIKMPAPIERCVRKQNVNYLHNKNQFSPEYFRFMRRLLVCNAMHIQPIASEEKPVRERFSSLIKSMPQANSLSLLWVI